MPRYRQMSLSGWGNRPVEACRVARPEKVRELPEILADAAGGAEAGDGGGGGGGWVISRGLGRCYGDAAQNAGGAVVLHERLNRFLGFDPATGIVECEAGVTFAELLETFLPRGWFPPVSPGTKFVTMGGALAADVHGKNHHVDGSIAGYVEDFTLLTGAGRLLRCSRTERPEVFWATIGGMGLTGMIVSLRLRLRAVESAFVTVDYRRAKNLDEALETFATESGGGGYNARRYSVAWLDCLARGGSLGRCVLMCGDHTPAKDVPERCRAAPLETPGRRDRAVPASVPNWALNSATVGVLNRVYYATHRDGRHTIPFDRYFYPLDSVLHWNRLYGKRGFQQYQAVLPMQESRRGLVRLLEELTKSRRGSFLAVLKSMGPESGGTLSFPMPGWTIAVDLPQTEGLDEFLRSLDRITLDHGGRRYLAKDASMNPADLARMYPRLDEFRAVAEALDPEGRVQSSLSRRLGIRAPRQPRPPAAPAPAPAAASAGVAP